MATVPGEKGDGWEELAVPPEVVLGNQSSDGKLQEESVNSDTVEVTDDAGSTMMKEPTSKTLLCGYLEKLGEKAIIKMWKRRWFVFQPRSCLLYYYRNPDDATALGHINISDATFAMNISSGRMDQFDICTANRVYNLKAPDQQTALYWLQKLQAKRREYSKKITALCHSGVEAVPEPVESPGLIATVASGSFRESDDEIIDSIPMPDTVGVEAAKRLTEGGKYGKIFKNIANKRYSMFDSVENSDADTVVRSSSISDDTPSKRLINSRKRFSMRSGFNMSVDKTQTDCPQCHKLKQQLKDCGDKLEEANEDAKAREEAINSLNEFIRQTVLERTSSQEDSSTTSHDTSDNQLYIKRLEKKMREQNDKLANYEKEIAMLKEVISSKDEIVMKTTNELATVSVSEETSKRKSSESELTQSPDKNSAFSSLGSDDAFRSFLHHIEALETDKEKVDKLKEALRAYIAQNNFLNSEVVEMNELRKNDTERIRSYIIKIQTQEANLCKIKSKFYFLVQQVNAPVKDGQTGVVSDEIITQLVDEAIEIESQTKTNEEGSQAAFDQYGFYTKLDRGDDDALATVADKLNRQVNVVNDDVRKTSLKVKWENYMMANRNKEFQKSPELKGLIRAGVPHDLRAKLWMKCVNSHVKPTKRISGTGYYKRLLASKKDTFCPAEKQIGLDLLRTLPNNKYYDKQNADGIDQLRRVLLAFSLHNKEIGYCQGLNRLAAIALLYLSEEESFWALVALVEYVMPQNYYNQTLLASQADQRVLKDILAEKIPKVTDHLDKLNIDLSLVTFNWFLTAFVDSVPIEIVLRIWDSLLYEGTKILFRFAVAIFYVNEAEILKITENMKMFTFLRNMPSQILNYDKFFQTAFQTVNPFPMQKITSLRVQHLAALKGELEELERARRAYDERKPNSNDDLAES
ncbi:TBC1 domain family member 2B-like isoform X2 [Dendronephthya gigantea]|uniref:TBC1 domain family member 2B-like isoform X2 n=1 Tax=Dendronephthya gigantea TaxID=151771 RepID=UPI00106CFD6C|nr:TBC1 domain family member 2B-like isoform X2 [Dendronephthya gigantea]